MIYYYRGGNVMRRNENYVDYDNEKKPIPWNRLFLSLLGIVLVILLVLLFMKFCGKKSLQPDLLKAGKEYYEKYRIGDEKCLHRLFDVGHSEPSAA